MTDDDLRAAIAAAPDDDTPRLMYADFLDDRGEAARAAFIRDQVLLARTPEWEPLAVNARYFRKHDVWPGTDFVPPPIDGAGPYIKWHPQYPTRRGFGHALKVESLYTLLRVAPALFEREPVQHLDLPSGTLDEWRELAAAPWFRTVRSLRFTGLTTPIEPLRELANSENAEGVREIAFDRCDSPAMPEVLRRLLRSPLGMRLTGLSLRLGEYPEEMVEAMEGDADEVPALERLGWVQMATDARQFVRLLLARALRNLKHIETGRDNISRNIGIRDRWWPVLNTIVGRDHGFSRLSNVAHVFGGCDEWYEPDLAKLTVLDIADNPIFETFPEYVYGHRLDGVKILRAARTNCTPGFLDRFVHSQLWHALAELDLSDNRLGDAAGERLVQGTRPNRLVAIDLRGNEFSDGMRRALEAHFEGAAIFE